MRQQRGPGNNFEEQQHQKGRGTKRNPPRTARQIEEDRGENNNTEVKEENLEEGWSTVSGATVRTLGKY